MYGQLGNVLGLRHAQAGTNALSWTQFSTKTEVELNSIVGTIIAFSMLIFSLLQLKNFFPLKAY